MQEVDTSKGASHARPDLLTSTLDADLSSGANMREDITLAHLDQGQFDVVAVGQEV